MKSADQTSITIDDRLRAALLWDMPSLLGFKDTGTRQWLDALNLNFLNLGEIDDHDPLSLAAHIVYASTVGDKPRAAELRATLRLCGSVGELFAVLLDLALAPDESVASQHDELHAAQAIISALADSDLRARLLLRVVAFCELRGELGLARNAAELALADTSPATRLGVVARRHASQLGMEIAGFSPWATTDTPEDPLIALPWVQFSVIDAVTALAAERYEQRLAGVWDAGFHIGRTKFDDLLAANTQAEWCGAVDLRRRIRRLLSTAVLMKGSSTDEETRWALAAWTSDATAKRRRAAVERAENALDAASADELLAAVRHEPSLDDNARMEVALGLWDLLDDESADNLLAWAAATDADLGDAVLRDLLWRRPEAWSETFEHADTSTRTRMLRGLGPRDLTPAPKHLVELLAAHATALDTSLGKGLSAALGFLTTGAQFDDPGQIDVVDARQLLDWDAEAVSPNVVAALVTELTSSAYARLRAATTGTVGFGPSDVGHLLGDIARHMPARPQEAIDALITTCGHAAAPAAWQLGALEGLSALRQAGHLNAPDIAAVRALQITPGAALFGESYTADVLRADQLRVLAPDLEPSDVEWLAIQCRGSDPRVRLIAMVTFGGLTETAPATVDWSLVGGLFDPDDDVVIRAVASVGRRGITADFGARPVARRRLIDLATAASSAVRREVVVTAKHRVELELSDIVSSANSDAAWTVRCEAEPPRPVSPGASA